MNFLRNLGLPEIIIIGIVLLFFMGGKKLNGAAKTAGETTKEFKKVKKEFESATKEVKKEVEDSINEE